MSSSGFLPKKQASDWLTYLVYKSEACFFGGNHFNSFPDSDHLIQDMASKCNETIAHTKDPF